MTTLYQDLGCEPGDSQETIKAAYRMAASRTHPDKEGGDKAEFQKVKAAYEVLSDPDRRAHYDKHGKDMDANLQDSKARQMAISAIMEVIEAASDDGIDTADVIGTAISTLCKRLTDVQIQRGKVARRIRKHERALKRMTGELARAAIEQHLKDLNELLQEGVEVTEVVEKAIKVVDSHRYATETGPTSTTYCAPLYVSSWRT